MRYFVSMLLVLVVLVQLTRQNWILSVQQTSSIVNSGNTLTILIKTSSVIPANSLKLVFDKNFDLNGTLCKLNTLSTSCTIGSNSTTLDKQVLFASTLTTNTTYTIVFEVKNPYYADNFEIKAVNGLVSFSTSGILTVDPKQVICQFKGLSNIVGDKTTGSLTIQNDAIPLNSQLSIKTPILTAFPNIFNPSPSCSFKNQSLACSMYSIFNQQILQVNSLPQIPSLELSGNAVLISYVNNPPYNNTFGSLELEVQDSLGHVMQRCTFSQGKPTVLQAVRNVVASGWNSGTGQQSNMSLYINPFFATLTNQSILIIYPSAWKLTPLSPTITISQSLNPTSTKLLLTNLTQTPSTLLLYLTTLNPTFLTPLPLTLYILYNQTTFRQQYHFTVDYFTLQTYTIRLDHTLDDNRTASVTKGMVRFNVENSVDKGQSGGMLIGLKVSLGLFYCDAIGDVLVSSVATNLYSACLGSQLIVSTDNSLLAKQYWLTFPILTHFSTQPITLTLTLTTRTGNHLITSNSLTYTLEPSAINLQITNLSPQLASPSAIIIKQTMNLTQLNYSDYLGKAVRRVVRLKAPGNLIFSNETTVTSQDTQLCTILKVGSVNSSLVEVTIQGYLAVQLKNITNPINYLPGNFLSYPGQRLWTIQTLDTLLNPSASGTSLMSPQYLPVDSKFTFSISNRSIQQPANLTITFQPQLIYSQAIQAGQFPTVTIMLSDSQISAVTKCPEQLNCQMLSQKKIIFNLTAVMVPVIILEIKNSVMPQPLLQEIYLDVTYGMFLYESKKETYQLESMGLEYVVGFTGLYAQIGILSINLTVMPKGNYTLVYSGQTNILQNPLCQNCTSSSITLKGRVKYFQKSPISLKAISTLPNGTQVTYAQSTTQIKYTCFSIPGCRICSNLTLASNITQLTCQKCFDKSLSPFSFLFNKQCVDSCPVQTYADETTCRNCPTNCYNCSDSTSCLECMPDFFVYTNTCVIQCPLDFIKNSTHCLPRPKICPTHCTNCPVDNMCIQCATQYKLLQNLCYSQCPSGYRTSRTNSSMCEVFIPPEQAKSFPFAFVICSVLFLIILIIIKCFQRRSLVMGNWIVVLSLLQFGSFVMTLIYTVSSVQLTILIQILLFIIILSKLLINLSFLLYFLKSIRPQEQFSGWLQKNPQNLSIYYFSLTISTMISFNMLRLIYSRFMGLKIFFGKFSSGLIFKPINYFSIALTLTYSAPLVVMCLDVIQLQEGYMTKVYYSAVETIVMEGVMVLAWVVDWRRGEADEFFDYQVHKVENEFEDSLDPVGLGEHNEVGGSMNQIMRTYRNMAKTQQWKLRSIPCSQGVSVEHSVETQQNQPQPQHQQPTQNPNPVSPTLAKKKSLFKIKIIKEWRQFSKNLPPARTQTNLFKKSRDYVSKSPFGRIQGKKEKKGKDTQLKRSASVDRIEIRWPQMTDLTAGEKVKRYFYRFEDGKDGKGDDRNGKERQMIQSVERHQQIQRQSEQVVVNAVKRMLPAQQICINNQPNHSNYNKPSTPNPQPHHLSQQSISQSPQNIQFHTSMKQITQLNQQKSINQAELPLSKNRENAMEQKERKQRLEEMLEGLTEIKGDGEYDQFREGEDGVGSREELLLGVDGVVQAARKLNQQVSGKQHNQKVPDTRPLNKSLSLTQQYRYNNHISSNTSSNIINIDNNASISKAIREPNSNMQISLLKPTFSPTPQPQNKKHPNPTPVSKSLTKSFQKQHPTSRQSAKNPTNTLYGKQPNPTQQKFSFLDQSQQMQQQTNRKKRKRHASKRKKSKAQKQTQKLYLQRLSNIEEKKMLSQRKRYKELSDF